MSVPHTPGPWTISNLMTGAVDGPEGWMVASVYGDDRNCTRDARQDANSYLIAAAPDLLEALKACVDVLMAGSIGERDRALAAIAKAEGQQS
jgi:hypothetical protein